MARLLTIFLVCSSSLLLCCCHSMKSLRVMDSFTNCPPVYHAVIRTASYKTNIRFYSRELSGLMVFKALNDTTTAVAFITEMGFKYFEFEFGPSHSSVQYILPAMNKKIIVRTLQEDIGLLVRPPIENSARAQISNDVYTVLKFPKTKKGHYYTTDKKCNQLLKVQSGTDQKKYLTIDLQGKEGQDDRAPETINVAHSNMKLTIFMKLLHS